MADHEAFLGRARVALKNDRLAERFAVRKVGNSPSLSAMLVGLIAGGEKTGLFSRPSDLEPVGGMPAKGDFAIVTDHEGRPRCLLQFTECRLMRFGDIGPEQTACESPAARDLDTWRGIHRQYWTPVLAAEGKQFNDDLPVVFQRFRCLYSESA